jgi:hypothetical protein
MAQNDGININTVQNIRAGIKRIITEIVSLDKEKLFEFVFVLFIRKFRLLIFNSRNIFLYYIAALASKATFLIKSIAS